MKITKHYLKKIEELFSAIGYIVRFEKGRFQSGYCILEDKKVVVINRFFDTEARGNALIDILSSIKVDIEILDEINKTTYKKIRKVFFQIPNQDSEQQI